MRNKRIGIILTAVFLLLSGTMILAGCEKKTPEEEVIVLEEDQQEASPAEDVGQDSEHEEADPIQNDRPEGEYELEESLLTQQEAENLLEPLTQWAGLYMIGMLDQTNTFDGITRLQMAGITVANGCLPQISSEITMANEIDGVWNVAPEGYLYASPEQVKAAYYFFFGEEMQMIPSMDDPEQAEKLCLNDGEGGLLVKAGDWGTAYPLGVITSIEPMGGILNLVTVSYVMYDAEENAITDELGWIEYYTQGTAESGETPKIIDMNIQVLYTNQDVYLPENWEEDAEVWAGEDYFLKIPAAWQDRYYVHQKETGDSFICSASAEENYTGVLFTISRVPKDESIEVPFYEEIGEHGDMVYIAVFSTDVTFDPDNGYSAGEYHDLSCYIDGILSTIYFEED